MQPVEISIDDNRPVSTWAIAVTGPTAELAPTFADTDGEVRNVVIDMVCTALDRAELLITVRRKGEDVTAQFVSADDIVEALPDLSAATIAKYAEALARVDVPTVDNLAAVVLDAIGPDGSGLNMEYWHAAPGLAGFRDDLVWAHHRSVRPSDGSCSTTHCLAGWAVELAGDKGRALERDVGTEAAGALIWHRSTGKVPDFHAVDEAAIAMLRAEAGR